MAAFAVLLAYPAFGAGYEIYCPSSTDGISVRLSGQRTVEATNTSSECRRIGIAVYMIYAEPNLRVPPFYSEGTYDIQPGRSFMTYAHIPPCKYVIDVFAGPVIEGAQSGADYGGRLLEESYRTEDPRYCPPPDPTLPTWRGEASDGGTPVGRAPLPSPRTAVAFVPLPQPKVLGAAVSPTSTEPVIATSSLPLAPKTGSGAFVPLAALLGSMASSGCAAFIARRKRFCYAPYA